MSKKETLYHIYITYIGFDKQEHNEDLKFLDKKLFEKMFSLFEETNNKIITRLEYSIDN